MSIVKFVVVRGFDLKLCDEETWLWVKPIALTTYSEIRLQACLVKKYTATRLARVPKGPFSELFKYL